LEKRDDPADNWPEDLEACVRFHGHLCPGLIYGFLVAKAGIERMGIERSKDEEVVVIAESDSCAIDALQVVLGATAGKGNLIVKDYGKNAYTILHRSRGQALRFSRKQVYTYQGPEQETFRRLEAAVADGTATHQEKWQHKQLKAEDLLAQPVENVFTIAAQELSEPPYAPLARSQACAECGEMTMATKLVMGPDGRHLCRPCAKGRI
jgi:formylmethanofuran dehydrogenase subunit E